LSCAPPKFRAEKHGSVQERAVEVRAVQPGAAEIRAIQPRTAEVRSFQVRACQISAVQVCPLQICILQICPFQIGATQACRLKVSPMQIYVFEKTTFPRKAEQIHFVVVEVFERVSAAAPFGIHRRPRNPYCCLFATRSGANPDDYPNHDYGFPCELQNSEHRQVIQAVCNPGAGPFEP
jgi:hypothetical protein